MRISLRNGHSRYLHRSEALYRYCSVGAHRALNSLLRSTIDVDKHGIARTQTVVLRCGNVHVWLECEHLVVKDVTSEHLALATLFI